MAVFKPFSCVRPSEELAAQVATRPYDVMNEEEARLEVAENPRSFLSLSRPEVHFPQGYRPTTDEIHTKASEQLKKWMEEGVFFSDAEEAYYVYELRMGEHEQTGLVGCAAVDDYRNHVVRQHEKVRLDKLEDRTMHIRKVGAQTGPVFLAYSEQHAIDELVNAVKKSKPIYDFLGVDGVDHRVWKVTDLSLVHALEDGFSGLDTMYIADGHHRACAAVRYCEECRQANPDYTGQEPFNTFLAVAFPDEHLDILPYHRVVKDLNGWNTEEFLARVKESFWIKTAPQAPYQPEKKGFFGMYLEERWYQLEAKESILNRDPVEGLDVSLLQNHLLGPILGITDPRTDPRIDFVGGIRGLGELERRCHTDMKVAFSLYPTSIRELFDVADADLLMPPKSTWFEPKLASGLFLHFCSSL